MLNFDVFTLCSNFNDYEFVVINGIYQKPLTSIMCKLVHVVNCIISGERYRTNGPLVCFFLNISFVKAGGVWQAKCRISLQTWVCKLQTCV